MNIDAGKTSNWKEFINTIVSERYNRCSPPQKIDLFCYNDFDENVEYCFSMLAMDAAKVGRLLTKIHSRTNPNLLII
jgi:hypothetical protein